MACSTPGFPVPLCFQVMTDNLHLGRNDWNRFSITLPRSICIFTRGLFGHKGMAVVDLRGGTSDLARPVISFQRFHALASCLGPEQQNSCFGLSVLPRIPRGPAAFHGSGAFSPPLLYHLSERGSWGPFPEEGCAPRW